MTAPDDVVERAALVMGQHYLDPNYSDPDNGDGCICGGWTSGDPGVVPGWDDHLADVLADAGLLAGAGAPTEPADDRLAAQDAADEEEGHGPWHYLSGGILCSCGYPVDRDERCTRPRTPEGQHEVLVGALYEAADNLLARFDRGPDKLDVDEAEVAGLQAARDALSAWGEANAAALAGSADDTQETT